MSAEEGTEEEAQQAAEQQLRYQGRATLAYHGLDPLGSGSYEAGRFENWLYHISRRVAFELGISGPHCDNTGCEKRWDRRKFHTCLASQRF